MTPHRPIPVLQNDRARARYDICMACNFVITRTLERARALTLQIETWAKKNIRPTKHKTNRPVATSFLQIIVL